MTRAFIVSGIAAFGMLALGSPRVQAAQAHCDFSQVSSIIQGWIDRGYYKGASLYVAHYGSKRNDEVLIDRTYGSYSSHEVVYIASAGKWLAAATIASVVADGKLSWDDPASKWIPELAGDPKGNANLRELMSHTSGYPPYQPDGNPVDNYQTLGESVAHLIPLPLHYAPGSHFEYGGLGMQVAGRMAEIATGKDWETLFQERIARPCHMTNTHFSPVDTIAGGHAPTLGGGARSTLHDYANFLSMIAHNGAFEGSRVLTESEIREMQADQVGAALVAPNAEFVERARGEIHNGIYGIGEWREQLDAQGSAVLLSSPSWAGAYPWIDKTRGIYGFFLTHVDTSSPTVTRDHFSSFYGSPCLAMMTRELVDTANMPPISRSMVDIGHGVHLYTERAGHGPVVIFLHAHSLDCREWTPQFAALSTHYTVIRYDLRGYGKSDLPVEGQQFTHADDLYHLMKALGVRKANLVGLSLGGLVVTDFLALHPEMVNSAVVASGAIHDTPTVAFETAGEREALLAKERSDKVADAAAVNRQGLDAYKKQWFESLMGNCASDARESIRPMTWQMIQDWSAWQPSHVEANVLLSTAVAPMLADKKPGAPVLVVMGQFDSAGSHASPEKLLAVDPHAHAVTIEGAGHLSNMEQPEKFTEVLEQFVGTVPQEYTTKK